MKSISLENYSIIEDNRAIFEKLLVDKTTGHNIVWGTSDYSSYGPGYGESDFIQYLFLFGSERIIRPRVFKSEAEKRARSRDKAEVFTPTWIVNCQNNLVDDQWIGKSGIFNIESDKGWKTTEKIDLGGRWKEYVRSTRLEVCCGEAPYLTTRYDPEEGFTIPVSDRVGLLDRKLRVVSEYAQTKDDWLKYAEISVKSIYGYDLQGDNVLLSRENLLLTFIEYYENKFDELPDEGIQRHMADIVAWNIWQMDGEKYVAPFSCNRFARQSIDGVTRVPPCIACKTGKGKHLGNYCRIKDWDLRTTVVFSEMLNKTEPEKTVTVNNKSNLDRWL